MESIKAAIEKECQRLGEQMAAEQDAEVPKHRLLSALQEQLDVLDGWASRLARIPVSAKEFHRAGADDQSVFGEFVAGDGRSGQAVLVRPYAYRATEQISAVTARLAARAHSWEWASKLQLPVDVAAAAVIFEVDPDGPADRLGPRLAQVLSKLPGQAPVALALPHFASSSPPSPAAVDPGRPLVTGYGDRSLMQNLGNQFSSHNREVELGLWRVCALTEQRERLGRVGEFEEMITRVDPGTVRSFGTTYSGSMSLLLQEVTESRAVSDFGRRAMEDLYEYAADHDLVDSGELAESNHDELGFVTNPDLSANQAFLLQLRRLAMARAKERGGVVLTDFSLPSAGHEGPRTATFLQPIYGGEAWIGVEPAELMANASSPHLVRGATIFSDHEWPGDVVLDRAVTGMKKFGDADSDLKIKFGDELPAGALSNYLSTRSALQQERRADVPTRRITPS